MTPKEMAKRDCANWWRSGACIGAPVVGLDGTMRAKLHREGREKELACRSLEKCLLLERPLRPCDYFEAVVLPLADNPSPKREPRLQQRRRAAREAYYAELERQAAAAMAARRPCPGCGVCLDEGERYCPDCRGERRRQSNLEAQRRRRAKNGIGE